MNYLCKGIQKITCDCGERVDWLDTIHVPIHKVLPLESKRSLLHTPRAQPVNNKHGNLVPRVLRLFGQRGGARRDSGIMEFLIPENVGFRS